MKFFLVFWVMIFGVLGAGELLAYDEFGAQHFPDRIVIRGDEFLLQLKGRMQVGLHDLEGYGGPGYDSTTDTQTIGTRSPFVSLDAFDLSFRVGWDELLWLKSVVSFSTSGAWLDSIVFNYVDQFHDFYQHEVEIGYASSIVAIHRESSRYPLIGLMHWRNREFQANYSGLFKVWGDILFKVRVSLSMMRPLKASRVHDSKEYRGTLSVMGYGNAEVYSGNKPSGTALLGVRAYGFFVDVFGSYGRLSTQGGVDRLVSDFPYYRYLKGFDPDTRGGAAYWYGARVGYEALGFRVMGEYIYSVMDLLKEEGWYLQGSYTRDFGGRFFSLLGVYFRYEVLRVLDSQEVIGGGYSLRSPELSNAISWDYEISSLGAKMDIYRDFISLRVEYSFFQTQNGVRTKFIANQPFEQNELLVQLEAKF